MSGRPSAGARWLIDAQVREKGAVGAGEGASPEKKLADRASGVRVVNADEAAGSGFYPDAHRYRLGVNYDSLPVNKPQCPYHTYNKDGAMRFDGNGGPTMNYEPNSFGGPTQDQKYVERPKEVSGTVARHDHRSDTDYYYTQPGNLFRLMTADAQERLIGNIVGQLETGAATHTRPAGAALLQGRSNVRNRGGEGTGAGRGGGARQESGD
jgi:hypothetical protein